MTDTGNAITASLVADADRSGFVQGLFGINFPMRLEPTIFAMADLLAPNYGGGLWHFHALSNGGFYMAPEADAFEVVCENGYEGTLSADALGITACMYAYSQLSFDDDRFAAVCAEHYHRLRDFFMGHAEVGAILAACD